MTLSSILPRSLVFLLGIGLIAGAAGCSLQQSDDFRAITVENAMDESLVFSAYEKEFTHRLYVDSKLPVDAITSGAKTHRIFLEASTSTTISKTNIGGEYGADKTLRLFLYKVRGDTAYRESIVDASYDSLRRENFRIEVSGFSER